MKTLMTITELAELLQVDTRTIYRRLNAGTIPKSIRGTKRPRLWSRTVVNRWLEGGAK